MCIHQEAVTGTIDESVHTSGINICHCSSEWTYIRNHYLSLCGAPAHYDALAEGE